MKSRNRNSYTGRQGTGDEKFEGDFFFLCVCKRETLFFSFIFTFTFPPFLLLTCLLLYPCLPCVRPQNVFIPGNMWKLWMWWLLAILTCGLFVIYYYVELWCVKNKYCTRNSLQMESGRMVVTSKGRILIWKTEAFQVKTKEGGWCFALCCNPFLLIAKCIRLCKCCCVDECAPPVTYQSVTDAMAFRV